MRSFGSDNHSGIAPEILEAIAAANLNHCEAYGADDYTLRAKADFCELFGRSVEVYFVFNGTGANILSLSSGMQPYNSILCAHTAHINVDECGAPERQIGGKVIAIETPDGKLTPERVRPYLHGFGFEHHSQPKFISIAQCTELGTVYTPEEIEALSELAHSHNMYLHIDGARIANAVASSGVGIAEMTRGADVLSFGGTKNGMMCGEAVVILNPELGAAMPYQRKQAMQLYSKMRFVSAQFSAYLKDDLWLRLASGSNEMAQLLADGISQYFPLAQKVEANEVFVKMPRRLYEELLKEYFFYVWDEEADDIRFVCSFDTTRQDVEALVAAVAKLSRNL
ncbi:MAG: low specificity L-threonine aldolase [Rikenellaceae bacterium]